jgi:hypothetical protein
MSAPLRVTIAAFSFSAVLAIGGLACAGENIVTPQGQSLARQLDRMGVETKWIAGVHVDWETGLPDGGTETLPGRHTHCSAFVAAAAKMLGVYILRPPQHGQLLLANAQSEWLAGEGRSEGWRPVAGAADAQSAANHGFLVVASYHNHRDDKPGHIAIVRPGDKDGQQLAAEGPDLIQAGTVNSASVSAKAGFSGHRYAWNNDEIEYYAHSVKFAVSEK